MMLLAAALAGASLPTLFHINGIWHLSAQDAAGRPATLTVSTDVDRGVAWGADGPFRFGGREAVLRKVSDRPLRTTGGELSGTLGAEDLRGLSLFLAHRGPSSIEEGAASPERVREWLGENPVQIVLSPAKGATLFVSRDGASASLQLSAAFGSAEPSRERYPDLGRVVYGIPQLGQTTKRPVALVLGPSIAGMPPAPFVATLWAGDVTEAPGGVVSLSWDALAVPRAVLDLTARRLWLPRQTPDERAAVAVSRLADLPASDRGEVSPEAQGELAKFVGWRYEKVNGQPMAALMQEGRGEAPPERLTKVLPWMGDQRIELARGKERKTIKLKARRRST